MKDLFLDAEGGGSRDIFRLIVMESADAVVAINSDQKVVLFSAAAEKLFGYSSDEILGQPLGMLLPQRYRSGHAAKVNDFHRGGNRATYMGDRKSHLAGLRKDGAEVMLGATILTVTTARGPIMVAMLRDISERIKLQVDLFTNNIRDLEGVDPYEASTRISSLMTQIETSYTLTARIQQLSLVRYL